jgi:hypothetical protein
MSAGFSRGKKQEVVDWKRVYFNHDAAQHCLTVDFIFAIS